MKSIVSSLVGLTKMERALEFDAKFVRELGISPESLVRRYQIENKKSSEITKRLRNGDYSIAIMAPNEYLESILSQGIKNLHETKYGGGVENLDIRKGVELSLSGMTEEQYLALPDKWKPKYAMLWPALNSSLVNITFSTWGKIALILKEKNFIDRLTWTPMDSFDIVKELHYKTLKSGKAIDPDKLTWYQQFIPLSRIDLATLFVHEYDKAMLRKKSENKSFMPKKIEIGSLNVFFNPPERANHFLEFQVWDEINPTDIKAIVFLSDPPSEENLKRLKELSIVVYDGRSGQRVLWEK
ncbi:MAG: hypothetical protein J0M15_12050 [Deltaproteobacteria bacterium]|nr:hypothetical protein [Deltaproteobacteria bacterium]